jgi:anaerobic selenocysteine-containing dehydrogenase
MAPLDSSGSSTRRVVRAACPHDCPDTCAMLVTVENGRAIEIKGAPDHPTTDGALCTKVARYLERTYSPDRLRHPMKRVGAKGEGRFARISWDEALDEIASNFKAIGASPDGPGASRTVEVFAARMKVDPLRFAELLASPEAMEQRVFSRVSQETLSAYRAEALERSLDVIQAYWREDHRSPQL